MEDKYKEDSYFKICNSVLKYEVAKGHLKWTISDISRDSGVARSLVYYYFGKKKDAILNEAYKYIIEILYSLRRDEHKGLKQRMKETLDRVNSMPYVFILVYLEKNKDSEIGELIRNAEKSVIENLKHSHPNLDHNAIMRLFLTQLGCVAFQLPPEQVDAIFSNEK